METTLIWLKSDKDGIHTHLRDKHLKVWLWEAYQAKELILSNPDR